MKISSLTLYTRILREQEKFYTETLGFQLIERAKRHFSVQIGTSILTFKLSKQEPIYHFAFNIPSDAINLALPWLKERVDIIPIENATEIAHFDAWNAEAIYFCDPAGNILEFIARKNLSIPFTPPFSIDAIQNISEIGMPVLDVPTAVEQLQAQTNMHSYSTVSEDFHPIGDENGLIILVNAKTKKWYPTAIPVQAFTFRLDFKIAQKSFHLDYSSKGLRLDNAHIDS